ncbi:hypothetical protein HPP92_028502 [Vanilla planifolia]|uniref:Coiled-coil domain-containing protein 22 homolog n=1 Tax=Vanilla planifolia TaxID=51239 RepID=A0A835P782_VANPL|nr:hypothetical protein HPP92_028502 [Vanilla planifolia]
MDEVEEILLNSLKRSGVSLPVGVSSIKDFSPDALVSICSQSLCLILNCAASSFPTSLPDSTAYRFKICSDVALAIKSLGYREELSFHQFLYPSDEEVLKLARFLVERLSEESSRGISVVKYNSAESITGTTEALAKVCEGQLSETSNLDGDLGSNKSLGNIREETIHDLSQRIKNCADEQDNNPSLRLDNVNELRNEIKDLEGQEKLLMNEMHDKALTLQKLQDEHEIWKAALDLVMNDKKSMELHIEETDAKVKSKQQRIIELETKSNVAEHSTKQLKDHDLLARLKEIKQETDSTLAEISKQEAHRLDLLVELRKQPKLPSRKSYIKRITQISKNSRKLDTDIQQILKETRQLQLESNTIQERLHRTYAMVNELVFRERRWERKLMAFSPEYRTALGRFRTPSLPRIGLEEKQQNGRRSLHHSLPVALTSPNSRLISTISTRRTNY